MYLYTCAALGKHGVWCTLWCWVQPERPLSYFLDYRIFGKRYTYTIAYTHMKDLPLTSCLRPLWKGLTVTITGNPKHLPQSASAYEGDFIQEVSSKKCLSGTDPEEKRQRSRTEATGRLDDKRYYGGRGRSRRWRDFRIL